MATAKRPLTVAKVEWTRASKAQIAKGMLGPLKVTIEAEGKFVSFLRDVKVRGKIRGMSTLDTPALAGRLDRYRDGGDMQEESDWIEASC